MYEYNELGTNSPEAIRYLVAQMAKEGYRIPIIVAQNLREAFKGNNVDNSEELYAFYKTPNADRIFQHYESFINAFLNGLEVGSFAFKTKRVKRFKGSVSDFLYKILEKNKYGCNTTPKAFQDRLYGLMAKKGIKDIDSRFDRGMFYIDNMVFYTVDKDKINSLNHLYYEIGYSNKDVAHISGNHRQRAMKGISNYTYDL